MNILKEIKTRIKENWQIRKGERYAIDVEWSRQQRMESWETTYQEMLDWEKQVVTEYLQSECKTVSEFEFFKDIADMYRRCGFYLRAGQVEAEGREWAKLESQKRKRLYKKMDEAAAEKEAKFKEKHKAAFDEFPQYPREKKKRPPRPDKYNMVKKEENFNEWGNGYVEFETILKPNGKRYTTGEERKPDSNAFEVKPESINLSSSSERIYNDDWARNEGKVTDGELEVLEMWQITKSKMYQYIKADHLVLVKPLYMAGLSNKDIAEELSGTIAGNETTAKRCCALFRFCENQ